MSYASQGERAALIEGLRALAGYLESNPAVPAPNHADIYTFPPDYGCEVMRAEVDATAALLRVQVGWTVGGHYVASRMFGPVEYWAVAICNEHDHRQEAAR